jgi:hypothetical protein
MLSNVVNCDRYEIQPMHSMTLPESLTGFSVPLLPNTGYLRDPQYFPVHPLSLCGAGGPSRLDPKSVPQLSQFAPFPMKLFPRLFDLTQER